MFSQQEWPASSSCKLAIAKPLPLEEHPEGPSSAAKKGPTNCRCTPAPLRPEFRRAGGPWDLA